MTGNKLVGNLTKLFYCVENDWERQTLRVSGWTPSNRGEGWYETRRTPDAESRARAVLGQRDIPDSDHSGECTADRVRVRREVRALVQAYTRESSQPALAAVINDMPADALEEFQGVLEAAYWAGEEGAVARSDDAYGAEDDRLMADEGR